MPFFHLFLLLLTAIKAPVELVSHVEELQINALLRSRIVSQLKGALLRISGLITYRCLVWDIDSYSFIAFMALGFKA